MGGVEINIRDIVAQYAKHHLEAEAYLIENADKNLLGILVSDKVNFNQAPAVNLLIRSLGHLIVVDHDTNEKPFYEVLMQAGVLREHIILRYTGESLSQETVSRMFYERFLEELQIYAGNPLNGRSYLTSCKTQEGELFAIITTSTQQKGYAADAGLIVEWRETQIIIHHDENSITASCE